MTKANPHFSMRDLMSDDNDDIDFIAPPKKMTTLQETPENGGNYFLGGAFDNSEEQSQRIKDIRQARWKSIYVQATHISPYSKVYTDVKKEPKSKPRSRVLAVAWPDELGTIQHHAWDLDKMHRDDVVELVQSVLQGNLIAHNAISQIGWLWNSLEDAGISDKPYPEYVQCTRLLAKSQMSSIDRTIRELAKTRADIMDVIVHDNNKCVWLDYNLPELGLILNLPNHTDIQNKLYNGNEYLAQTLNPMHYRHAIQSVLEPVMLLHHILSPEEPRIYPNIHDILSDAGDFLGRNWKASKKLSFYKEIFMPATKHYMRISQNGVPFNMVTASYYKQLQANKLLETVDSINEFNYPDLVPFKDVLKTPNKGLNDDLNDAFARTFKMYDPDIKFVMGAGYKPKLGSKELRKMRINKGPAAQVYELLTNIQSAKQGYKTVQSFIDFAYRAAKRYDSEGNMHNRKYIRLHPIFSFKTMTDRMATEEPTTQNWKNDATFRSMIHAKENHSIISADYSQIELRNAAALALRSQMNIHNIIENHEHQEPTPIGQEAVSIMRQIWSLDDIDTLDKGIYIYDEQDKQWTALLDMKLESFNQRSIRMPDKVLLAPMNKKYEDVPFDYQALKDKRDIIRLKKYAAIIRKLQLERGNNEPISLMAEAFRRNIDVHLLTALSFAIKTGKYEIPEGSDILSYLGNLNKEELNHLKETFDKERRGAKATNFGLLYGMRTDTLWTQGIVVYGLDWTIEEAREAEHIWFNLFPEIGLYQYFSILCPTWEGELPFVRNGQVKTKKQRYWKCVSLFGREYEVDDFKKGLNYQNQGTGAHVIQKSMELMPEYISSRLINQIHDESVAEIPNELLEQAVIDKRNAMVQAAQQVLSPFNIPVAVDIEVNEVWVHGDKPDQIPDDFLEGLSL